MPTNSLIPKKMSTLSLKMGRNGQFLRDVVFVQQKVKIALSYLLSGLLFIARSHARAQCDVRDEGGHPQVVLSGGSGKVGTDRTV